MGHISISVQQVRKLRALSKLQQTDVFSFFL